MEDSDVARARKNSHALENGFHSSIYRCTRTQVSVRDLYPCRRASYEASRVSMAQSRYESAVSGATISQEERVMMARSDLHHQVPCVCTKYAAISQSCAYY